MSSGQTQLTLDSNAGEAGTDKVSQAAGSGQVISTYCQTVLEQPVDGVPDEVQKVAPNYVSHLKTAQGNANHFISDVYPVMQLNISDLLSFSNMWSSYTGYIRQYVNSGEYDTAIQGLQQLQNKVKVFSTNASNTHSTLLQYQKSVTGDARAFSSDYQALTSSEAGLPAEIAGYDKEIDAENSAINKGAAMIAGGAAAALIGGIMIVGGAVSDVFTGGAATVVIGAGVLAAAGGVALIVTGSITIDKASKALANATKKKAALKKELVSLKAYDSTMKSLEDSVTMAVSAIGNLASSWEYLHDDMDNVIGDLKTAGSSTKLPWFDATMNTADKDWEQVGKLAKAVQIQIADAKYTKTSMDGSNASLLDALPGDTQKEIRDEEARKNAA